MATSLVEIAREMEEHGFCVMPSILVGEELERVRKALDDMLREMEKRGIPTHDPLLDPNANNIRVYNLPDFSPVFVDLLRHPLVLPAMKALLADDAVVSNFTGNIALPGSRSMRIHADQALVMPPPWMARWTMNMIWCLDDVHEANGATLYVPGSHRYRTFGDVPEDVSSRTRPFFAKAGSVIAMDGRLWHTSGINVTKNEKRAMLFAYYSRGFVRQQANWEAALSPETKDRLDEQARALLGMGPLANAVFAFDLVGLDRSSRLVEQGYLR